MTDYKLVPVEGLRYTSDGALAECPCCGSLDVGGAHDIVHCQSCGLTVSRPRPLQNAIDAWNTRTRHTHTPSAIDVQGEPAAHEWDDAGERCMACGDKDWFASPSCESKQKAKQHPAPDVSGLVDALEMAVNYLDYSDGERIESRSIAHRTMSDALAAYRKGGDA